MVSTLIVLPVFALIFAGWLAGRCGVLGPAATSEINRFVVYLAMPALLFDIVAHARWAEIWQPGFIAAFGLAALAVFGATVLVRMPVWKPGRRHLADAAIDGLNAGYANTGFVGFPLVLAALGPAGLAPVLIASIVTICVLFALAIVLVEIGVQNERRVLLLMRKVGGQLVRNPLLIGPALGRRSRFWGLRCRGRRRFFSNCWADRHPLARWWRWGCFWPGHGGRGRARLGWWRRWWG